MQSYPSDDSKHMHIVYHCFKAYKHFTIIYDVASESVLASYIKSEYLHMQPTFLGWTFLDQLATLRESYVMDYWTTWLTDVKFEWRKRHGDGCFT